MVAPYEQLDRRFDEIRPLAAAVLRPAKGWIRAIRDGLGMTTKQLAGRMGVTQPRITELERAEASGKITVQSLERAAEAMGCRLVYTIVPLKPLAQTMIDKAGVLADRQLTSVEQTMRLEDQSVTGKSRHEEARRRIVTELLRRPARLWDDA